MDGTERRLVLREFETSVLPALTRKLADGHERLAILPVQVFAALAQHLGHLALACLAQVSGAETESDLDQTLKSEALYLAVVEMNGALPLSFPYCIGIAIYPEQDGTERRQLTVFERSLFPQFQSTQRFIPMVRYTKPLTIRNPGPPGEEMGGDDLANPSSLN
jgi:hypothetical protein